MEKVAIIMNLAVTLFLISIFVVLMFALYANYFCRGTHVTVREVQDYINDCMISGNYSEAKRMRNLIEGKDLNCKILLPKGCDISNVKR